VPFGARHVQDGPVSAQAWTAMDSPIGELVLGADDVALTDLLFETHNGRPNKELAAVRATQRDDDHPVLRAAVTQLTDYFAGRREDFDLPLAPSGSLFQRRVWAALLEIPYGKTTSYGEIARRLGLPPGGSRAVGLANGQNPIAIIIPCHRVIGSDGTLTGYGGGLPAKRLLLDLESQLLF
jgi:methylated-DNA-[protein]-cysteine S-methyltransferase